MPNIQTDDRLQTKSSRYEIWHDDDSVENEFVHSLNLKVCVLDIIVIHAASDPLINFCN